MPVRKIMTGYAYFVIVRARVFPLEVVVPAIYWNVVRHTLFHYYALMIELRLLEIDIFVMY